MGRDAYGHIISYRYHIPSLPLALFCGALLHVLTLFSPSHGETLPRREPPRDSIQEGMGGACYSLSGHTWSLFCNPALIGEFPTPHKYKGPQFFINFPEIKMGYNEHTQELVEAYSNAGEDRQSQVQNILNNVKHRDPLFAELLFFPHLQYHRYTFGLLFWNQFEGVKRRDLGEEAIEVRGFSEMAIVNGFSIPWKDTGLNVGLTVKGLARTYLQKTLSSPEDDTGEKSQEILDSMDHLRAIVADVGVSYQYPHMWLPTAGLTVQNVNSPRYFALDDSSRDLRALPRYHLGFSVHPPFGSDFTTTFAVDFIDFIQVSPEQSFQVGANIGFLGFGNQAPLSLQLGQNLNGFSFGISADFMILTLRFSSRVINLDQAGGIRHERRNSFLVTSMISF